MKKLLIVLIALMLPCAAVAEPADRASLVFPCPLIDWMQEATGLGESDATTTDFKFGMPCPAVFIYSDQVVIAFESDCVPALVYTLSESLGEPGTTEYDIKAGGLGYSAVRYIKDHGHDFDAYVLTYRVAYSLSSPAGLPVYVYVHDTCDFSYDNLYGTTSFKFLDPGAEG